MKQKIKLYLIAFIICLLFVACNKKSKDTLRFAFLTDIHVVPGNNQEQALKKVIAEINNDTFDFVVITGDLTNMGSDVELFNVKKILDSIKAPCFILPGNHETNWSETAGLTYQKLFGDDHLLFQYNNYQFIGFNTGPFMKMGDGHVKKEDLLWIEENLKETIKSENNIISLAHYPLAEGLDNWYEVTELLKKYDTKFALCGHGHRLKLLNFGGIPGIMGRALIGREADDIGYNIVSLKNDSVFIAEKPLNDKEKLVYKWDLGSFSIIDTINISPMPNKEINKQYPFIKTTWTYQDNASIMGGMALSSDSLLVWATSDGALKVVGKHSKKIKWEKKLGKSVFSTPVVSEDKVIIGTLQGIIKAFNILNGEELWSTNVNHPIFSEGVVEDGYIYISCGNGGVYKLSTLNGDIVWNFASVNGFLQSKVCLTDKEVIFGAWDKYLYCVDKINGSLNWKWTNGHNAILYSPGNVVPAVANNKVFLVAPDRYLTILDQKTGTELYRSDEHKVRESMGITANKKFVIAKLMNDSLLVISTQQSKPVLKQTINCGFGYEHNPCPLVEKNGIVYGGTKNGVLFAVDIDRQKLLWKHKIGNSAVNKILIDNKNAIWVVLMEGLIVSLS